MTTMPRRRFGRTELQMPVFSCGGMRFQHSWKDVPVEEIEAKTQQNVEAIVHRALELGINHIETARGYGTSEYQLGQILPSLPRDEMIVQTKVGVAEDPKEFEADFETSMENLGLEYVDLLAAHGINNAEKLERCTRKGGVLDVMRRLKKEGRIRHIGFSTHGVPKTIIDVIETGEFDYVNMHWYFVYDPVNWPAVEAAARQDMGVFIISPNEKGGKLFDPPDRMVELCRPMSPMGFNNLYCLSRDEVHTLSIGASKPSEFDEHIQTLKHFDQRAEISSKIAGRLREAMAERLGADWVAHWMDGIPDWMDIPGDVNVSEILRLWTFAKGLDLVDFGKMRYNLLGNAEDWFPGQNASKFDEAAVLKAVAASPFAERIPGVLREAQELLYEAPKKRLSESE